MYKNILVPVSLDDDRDVEGAIKVARKLVSEGGKINFLHVVEHIPGYAITYLSPEYLSERRKAVVAELAEMAANVPNASSEVVTGHSGRTVLEWAFKHNVDCIVIASHRPGLENLLLGSTATQVVRHADCAVHVIR
jgi:nucleotide-binding universal stress UspA family protein